MARSKGQGSISLRKDGVYAGRITRNGITKTFYSKDKNIVEKQLLEYSRMSNDDFQLKKVSIKFQQYLHDYIYTFKYGHIKDSSFDRLDTIYRVHILNSDLGVTSLCELNDQTVQLYINKKSASHYLSYSSVKKIYELIRTVLNYAYKKHDISIDIAGLIKMPDKHNFKPVKVIDVYPRNDIDILKNYILYPSNRKESRFLRYACAYLIMYYTGMRAGELLCLTWNDIDFDNMVIHINKTLSLVCDRDNTSDNKMHYINVINTPKTVNSIRDIPISSQCLDALKKLMISYDAFDCKCDYVVCNLKGEFIRLRSFEKKLKEICNKCNVEYRGVHALRHSFASHLIDSGIPPKVVSDLLGHSNVIFTLNRYVHTNTDSKIDAVNIL